MASLTQSSISYEGPSVYAQAILLCVLATIAIILTLPPLIQQIKSHNLSTTTLILSITVANLQNVANAVLWPNDDSQNWHSGHVICDIESKLQVGLLITISSAATCICCHLASILSPNRSSITPSASARRNRYIFEIMLCIIIPIVVMSLHILVQPYRYYIYGITGCRYSLHNSWLAFVLILLWPLLISLMGTAYTTLILFRLVRRHRQVSTLLANAQVSKSRFARVFVLAGTFALVYTPLAAFYHVFFVLDGSFEPWSWDAVHPRFWDQTIVRCESGGEVWFDRWVQVGSGFVLFGVFGLGHEAVEMYKRWMKVMGVHQAWKWLKNGWMRAQCYNNVSGNKQPQPEACAEVVDTASGPRQRPHTMLEGSSFISDLS